MEPSHTASDAPSAQPATTAGAAPQIPPLVVVAAAIVTVLGLKQFSDQIGPLLLAFILTIAVSPISGWLRSHGWPSALAVGATLVVSLGTLLAFVGSLIWSGYRIVALFTDDTYAQGLADLQDDVGRMLGDLGVREGAIQDALSNLSFESIVGQVGSALNGVVGILSALGVVAIAMFFMVSDSRAFADRMTELGSSRPYVSGAFDHFVHKTRSYLVVSTVFGGIVAILDGLALWAMGIPLAFVWVVLSFITNYVPNIGFVIGVIPPALVALIAFDVQRALLVIAVYVGLNFVIQSLIQPRVVGNNVGLSTTMTFLSLIFWSWVIGPLGAILAVPLTLLAMALLVDMNPQLQWLRPLISLRPADEIDPLVVPATAAETTGESSGSSESDG